MLIANTGGRYRESTSVQFVYSLRSLSCVPAAILMLAFVAQPAAAGLDEALKAMQAGDLQTAEKELLLLGKERDPRAQFLLGLYIYGNPESKLYDVTKATPLLLDAAERGYLPAMIPLAGGYAEGKGVPKSAYEAYKWVAIAERWNVANANLAVEQAARELKPDEIEKAKAAALAYTFKTK
jgi:TPR repeat protein